MKYNEKIDMFMGMVTLLRFDVDVNKIIRNIQNNYSDFENDIKTKIKGHHDDNIGAMADLVKAWAK